MVSGVSCCLMLSISVAIGASGERIQVLTRTFCAERLMAGYRFDPPREKLIRLKSVEDAMVNRQRHITHRTCDNVVVEAHDALFHLANAEYRDLRLVDHN